jgi:rod shape-determining protein MreC
MIPLLVLQLVLLSLQIESPSGSLLFKTWVLAAQAPVIALTSRVTGGIRDIWRNYIWMIGARAENERLRETVRRLSMLNSAYKQVKQENLRLHRLLSLSENIAFEVVGARVVARAPGFLSNVVYIDRGLEDGVQIDMPMLSGDRIAGRTIVVSRHQSQVQLISNPDASMGAMLEQTRTPGVLRGSGDLLMELDYVGNTEQVNVGDVVLSSGLDGIFPKGLVIGKVVDSRRGNGVFRSIKVEPGADLIRLEELTVLVGGFRPERGLSQEP